VKISVIIPCKDRPEQTKRLLNELCEQRKNYPQTEIIVVENGSTTDMSFLNDYDIILKHEEIKGDAHGRNIGLELSTGDYICFCDNDDMISKNYLDVIYQNIESKLDWYTWRWSVDGKEIDFNDDSDPLKTNWALWGYCFKRELIMPFRFDESKYAGSDLLIFDIITEQTKGGFIDEVLYYFVWNGNEDSLSHRHNRGETN